MKPQKHKRPGRPLGGSIDREKREADRRTALRVAGNLNAMLDVVSADERVILRGPVGGPRWLFKAKKKSEATLCDRERYL